MDNEAQTATKVLNTTTGVAEESPLSMPLKASLGSGSEDLGRSPSSKLSLPMLTDFLKKKITIII